MKNTKHTNLFILAIFILSIGSFSYGQTFEKFLQIKGMVLKRYDQKKLKEKVTITIKSSCGGSRTVVTENSKYKIYLEPGCDYEVHYDAADYINKFYIVETSETPYKDRKKRYRLPVDILMIREAEGLDTSIFQFAQGKTFYHPVLKGFVWDPDFTSKAIIQSDSVISSIGSADTVPLQVIQKEVKLVKKFNKEPLYLFLLKKEIPTNRILDSINREGFKPKSGVLSEVQKGIYHAKFNLYFLSKDSTGMLNNCKIYSNLDPDFKCSIDNIIHEIDDVKTARSNEFEIGQIVEKLYWLTYRVNFLSSDYNDVIDYLRSIMGEIDENKQTDGVLSFMADIERLIMTYDILKKSYIQKSDNFVLQKNSFVNLVHSIHANF